MDMADVDYRKEEEKISYVTNLSQIICILCKALFYSDMENTVLEDYIRDIQVNTFIEFYMTKAKQVILAIVLSIPIVLFLHARSNGYEMDTAGWEFAKITFTSEILLVLTLAILHYYPRQYPYMFALVIINFSVNITRASVIKDEYVFYEYTMPAYVCPFLMIIIMPSQCRMNCVAYISGTIYFLYCVSSKYSDLPHELYVAMFFNTFYFVISSIVMSWKVTALYKTILENERLVAENKNLLQIFPHGVIIQPKETKEDDPKCFTNTEFKRQIQDIQNRVNEMADIHVVCEDTKDEVTAFDSDLHTYLKQQQSRLGGDAVHEEANVKISCRPRSQLLSEDSDEESTEQRVFNLKTLEVTWEGRPSYMHVFMDTTDIRKLEEANNNIKCQRIMFASVSHEFRTPLNAIINSYQFIGDRFEKLIKAATPKPEDCAAIKKFLKMGQTSSFLLMSLIEDILDLSKMEGGTFKINPADFSPTKLVEEVYDLFEFQCRQKQIGLDLEISREVGRLDIHSDRARVKQVLLNLVANSLKFTFKGGITIGVNIVIREESRYLKFSVKDTGIGIKVENQCKLFELFGMVDEKSTINPNGCGIGLTISKKYVEKLGGVMKLNSSFGIGTKVTFSLPIREIKTFSKRDHSTILKGSFSEDNFGSFELNEKVDSNPGIENYIMSTPRVHKSLVRFL